MAEKLKCPYCEAEFKNSRALGSHVRYKHPGELGLATPPQEEPEEKEVPDAANDFELLLKDYGVKRASIIAKNIAATGSPKVFDDPKELAKKLARWPRDIAPTYRASILDHWFKSRGIILPEELIEEAGMEEEEKKEKAKIAEAEKKKREGAVWTVDFDESGMPKIRMIKGETEPGVTLAEAKVAIKEIGKEREESIVAYNDELGRHMPNFKSSFVKQNPAAAWATAKMMDKAMAEGETVDPMDIWIDQQAKLAQLKETMGISPEPKEKGTVSEIIAGLKDLQEMAKEGKVSGLPEWMSSPVEFIKTVNEITGAGERVGKPDWISDPVAFIETVQKITGGSKTDDAVKTELAELRKSLEDMKEERHRQEIVALASQIKTQQETHQKEMREILDKMENLKPITGRTEMDILHELATEGIGVIKTEAAGMRGMLSEVVRGAGLPTTKSSEEREQRKTKYRKALQTDQEIEQIGQRLFFGQS